MPDAKPDIWDARQYLRYVGERTRPLLDLLNRLDVDEPRHVADLGCGPGNISELISDRWPTAHVLGVDSSADMLAGARPRTRPGRLEFQQADLRDWQPPRGYDVIVANAVLQWVPGHLDVLPRLAAALNPGGRLGFQVPGNFDAPSHRIVRDMVASDRWRAFAETVSERPDVHDPVTYYTTLVDLGLDTDVWETVYYYVLDGVDGVTEWVRGTRLRPFLTRLSDAEQVEFIADYTARALVDYPPREIGGRTVQILPYRRLFAVGRRPD